MAIASWTEREVVKRVTEIERLVLLTLTEKEALLVRALLARVGGSGPWWEREDAIARELDRVGITFDRQYAVPLDGGVWIKDDLADG